MITSGRSRRGVAGVLALTSTLLGAAAGARAGEGPEGAQAPAESEMAPTPRLVLRVFGNIDWLSRRETVPNTFSVGQLDLFLTSELATNVNVLAEIVLEVPENGDEQIAEVERFQLRYSPLDALSLSVGRMHSMLGYWNQTYHHGAWLTTTAFRPEIYRFEDEGGGLLPVHEVGLRLAGTTSASALRLEYAASVTNGRDVEPGHVVTVQDPNGAKALTLWLGIKPKAWAGLQVGGAAVLDTIPSHPEDPARDHELRERIFGGFLVVQRSGLELLAEAFSIRHEDRVRGLAWKSRGLYAQGAWTLGRAKPYYRFDWIDRDEGDPYYDESTRDIEKHTAGLRVDPWSRLAVKLEASHSDVPGASFFAAAVQVAFTF
jgi:hypothetical protein